MSFNFSPHDLMTIDHLRYKRLWLGIGLLMLGLVVSLSLVTVPAAVQMFLVQDKLLHLLTYSLLMGWFAQLFRHDLTRLLFVVLFVLLGIVMEFLQGMTPSRQFDVLDMVANSSGVVLAWALAYTWVGSLLARVESLFQPKVLRA